MTHGSGAGFMSPMKGYQAIPALIRQAGIDLVFSMIGETNIPWIGEGVRSGAFRYIRTRHEGTAVSAAVGFSRTTGSVALATITRGPGYANAVNQLKVAVHDHIPVLVIVAESPPSRPKISPYYQNLDQRGITQLLGAGFHQVDRGSDLDSAFWSAYHAARWNGLPQVISLADGLLDDDVVISPGPPPDPERDVPDPEAVNEIVDVLAAAERPLVLAGQGALHAECREDLERLADLIGARVTSTLNVNRYFSGHPHNLGVCGHSSPTITAEILSMSDVVVVVGASFNPYTTGQGAFFKEATIVQVEVDPDQPFHASRAELGLLADAGDGVRALIAEWERRDLSTRPVVGPPTPCHAEIARSVLDIDLGRDPTRGLDPRRVFWVCNKKLPVDRVVVSDSGRWSGTAPTFLDARDGRSWLITRGYGSVGLGLGNAIGAAAGVPDRPVVLFCGDGGLMMTAQELDAVRLNELDLTIVIINDEAYGAEVPYLSNYGLPADTARQSMPDMVKLAEAFGGRAVVVRTDEELDALEFPGKGLFMVDVRVDPSVNGRAAL